MTDSSQPTPDAAAPHTAGALAEVLRSCAGHPLFPEGEDVGLSSTTFDGDTVLYLAALRGDRRATEVLLAHSAGSDAPGNMGNTALHYAAMNGQADLVTLLLRHGADPALRNEFGLTPQEWARQSGHAAVAAAFDGARRLGKEG